MARQFRLSWRALLALCLCLCVPSGARAEDPAVPGEVLVGLRTEAETFPAMQALVGKFGAVVGHHPALHALQVRLTPGVSLQAAITELRKRPEVLYAEPNYIRHADATPNDSFYSQQYGPKITQADKAWSIWQPKAQIVIAIVDTGLDNTHPDLTTKILRDASGIVGYSAVTGLRDNASDDHGHGTHCAGIAAAAINNGLGVAGIAGWNGLTDVTDANSVKLMPVKVLDKTGHGSDTMVASGITWAADHGANVISLSLSGTSSSTTLNNAVQYAIGKGCVVVAGAGNTANTAKNYPAACPNVISVAATDSNDKLASFSSYGSWVLVAAPGSSIYSTLPTYPASANFGTNYGLLSGTSMACPHVSGEAAMILGQNPSLTPVQVRNIIVTQVDAYKPYSGRVIASGAGRINIYRAALAAGNVTIPDVPTALAATPGNAQVSLTWQGSAGAISYNIKRAASSGGPYTTVVSSVVGTSYVDSGLTNNVPYWYVVSAVNVAGESANSAAASATPNALFVSPVTDAFVQAGTAVDTNFGASASLLIKRTTDDSTSSVNRCAYLKFDLTTVTAAPVTAKLILTVSSSSNPAGVTASVSLYSVADTTWTESGLTWNSAPGLNRTNFTSTGALLAKQNVSTSAQTAVIDLTSFVAANRGKVVTLQLIDEVKQNVALAFFSRENASSAPVLQISTF